MQTKTCILDDLSVGKKYVDELYDIVTKVCKKIDQRPDHTSINFNIYQPGLTLAKGLIEFYKDDDKITVEIYHKIDGEINWSIANVKDYEYINTRIDTDIPELCAEINRRLP